MGMAELHCLLVSFGFLLRGLVVLFHFRGSFQGLGDDVRGHRYWPGHDRNVHFYDCQTWQWIDLKHEIHGVCTHGVLMPITTLSAAESGVFGSASHDREANAILRMGQIPGQNIVVSDPIRQRMRRELINRKRDVVGFPSGPEGAFKRPAAGLAGLARPREAWLWGKRTLKVDTPHGGMRFDRGKSTRLAGQVGPEIVDLGRKSVG